MKEAAEYSCPLCHTVLGEFSPRTNSARKETNGSRSIRLSKSSILKMINVSYAAISCADFAYFDQTCLRKMAHAANKQYAVHTCLRGQGLSENHAFMSTAFYPVLVPQRSLDCTLLYCTYRHGRNDLAMVQGRC